MSSPHISFRLNHYQLAKALRILANLEPNQPIASLSQAVKIIVIDWISKHSINAPLATSQADIEAIKLICEIPTDQINPYTTIQTIMANAKAGAQQIQPQQIQTKEQSERIQREIEEEKIFAKMKQEAIEKSNKTESELDKQINLAHEASKRIFPKASEFHDPNITDSSISSVTDFSPPKDWIS